MAANPAHSHASPPAAPHTNRSIDVGGLRLRYLDYGTEGLPPILCVHGGAAHAHWFDFVAGGFTADYHMRSIDLRGHGDSEWVDPPAYGYERYGDDLAEVAEKLDLRDFVLMGHSMGGMVSVVYAANHPGRLAKLVVIDSMLKLSPERAASLRTIGMRGGRSYASADEFIARFRVRPSGTLADPGILRYLAERSARQMPAGKWRHKFDRNVYATREGIDSMALWNRIHVPAMIVKSDRSGRITPEIFAEVQARCPQIELAEVAHSDHHVTLDNPDGFVRAVRGFLAKGG